MRFESGNVERMKKMEHLGGEICLVYMLITLSDRK